MSTATAPPLSPHRGLSLVIKAIDVDRLLLAPIDIGGGMTAGWRHGVTTLRVEACHDQRRIDTLIRCVRASTEFLALVTTRKTDASVKKGRLPMAVVVGPRGFVEHLAAARPRLTLLVGGPGTGKTHSIVAAIQNILRGGLGRVLVLAPNDTSANVLASTLAMRGVDVMRIFSKQVSPVAVRDGPFSQLLQRSNAVTNGARRPQQPADRFDVDSEFADGTRQDLMGHAVICTTTGHCAWMGAHAPDFGFVFVDDATQAMLSEPLAAVEFVRATASIVLAGDPGQPHELGPCVVSGIAQAEGLGQSLLDQLSTAKEQDPDMPYPVVTLHACHRSHPEILKLYSGLFYFGALRHSGGDVHPVVRASFLPRKEVPMAFVDLASSNVLAVPTAVDGGASSGLATPDAAAVVVKVIARLLAENGDDGGGGDDRGRRLECGDIGVTVEHPQQVACVRKQLAALGHDRVSEMRVGTAETFVGQEVAVMIVCLAAPSSAVAAAGAVMPSTGTRGWGGLIGDGGRTKVALSRSKAMLVMVGELRAMKQEPWRAIAGFMQGQGLVITPRHLDDGARRPAVAIIPATDAW